MKMSKTQTNVITYDVNNEPGFMVEIVETEKDFESWLFHDDYNIKWFMFSCPKNQQSKEEFIEYVEASLDNRDYTNSYRDLYINA